MTKIYINYVTKGTVHGQNLESPTNFKMKFSS